MKIILDTDVKTISAHYIETLVLLYLPGEKFGAGEENPVLTITIRTENASVFVRAVLDYRDGTYREEETESLPASVADDYVKCFCGKIFLRLFGKKFGYMPPWGILTGVTPAKFAAGNFAKRKKRSGDCADTRTAISCFRAESAACGECG